FDQKLVAKNCLPQSEKFRNEVKEFGTILLPEFGFYQRLFEGDIRSYLGECKRWKILKSENFVFSRKTESQGGWGDSWRKEKKDNKPQDGAEGSSEQTTDKGSNWVWNRKEEQKQDQGGWKKKKGWVPSGCFTKTTSGSHKSTPWYSGHHAINDGLEITIVFFKSKKFDFFFYSDAEDFGPTTKKDGQCCSCNVEQRVPEMITGMESYQGKAVQYWDHISWLSPLAGCKDLFSLGLTSGIRAYEIPPPPPPPSSSQTPTQQTPHTVSTIKLPILKKGEYDIWAMKMEHYLAHTDYPIWEVIQNGNGPVSITTDTQGQIKVLPPRTAEEILARERERKARTTLLMALPEDHLAKFHKMTDAKEM
ncbi:hypothetical protein Tco_0255032, partial [Tanacetum coccineum]